MNEIEIHVDGACKINPGPSGTGFVCYQNGNIKECWYGLFNPEGTNNTAELNGIIMALKYVKKLKEKPSKIVVKCDSVYAIKTTTEWSLNWKKNGWNKKGGIKNLELVKEINALYEEIGHLIEFVKVKGHAGVEGNEIADRMANKAVEHQEYKFSSFPKEELNTLKPPIWS